jgi:molecular chaperone DnaK (HSP70)
MELNAKVRLVSARSQDWFDSLKPAEKKGYLAEHPSSKFGNSRSTPTKVGLSQSPKKATPLKSPHSSKEGEAHAKLSSDYKRAVENSKKLAKDPSVLQYNNAQGMLSRLEFNTDVPDIELERKRLKEKVAKLESDPAVKEYVSSYATRNAIIKEKNAIEKEASRSNPKLATLMLKRDEYHATARKATRQRNFSSAQTAQERGDKLDAEISKIISASHE